MKKTLLLLLLITSFLTIKAQEVVTDSKGQKIILNKDKTWQYVGENDNDELKITLELLSNNEDTQFQVNYDATGSSAFEGGVQYGGLASSGWKKIISIPKNKLEGQMNIKVGSVNPVKKYKVVLNFYVNNKLYKTVNKKAGNLLISPASLRVELSELKNL